MYSLKAISAIGIGIIVAGLSIAWIWFYSVPEHYSIVQLANGQMYVGKLNYFSRLKLTDVYAFQILRDEKNPEKNSFQLVPLRETLWAPTKLYFERSQVMFYGPLEETSKIVQGLRGKQ